MITSEQLLAYGYNQFSTILIYIAIFFMYGILMPSLLAPIYDSISNIADKLPFITPEFIRRALSLILLILPANLIIGSAFIKFNPIDVSVSNIIAVVITLIVIAVILEGIRAYLGVKFYIYFALFLFSAVGIVSEVEHAKAEKHKITQSETT